MRALFNALRYLAHTGCSWRYLPHHLPPWQTVYQQWTRWRYARVRLPVRTSRAGGRCYPFQVSRRNRCQPDVYTSLRPCPCTTGPTPRSLSLAAQGAEPVREQDGAVNAARFAVYLEQVLGPAWEPMWSCPIPYVCIRPQAWPNGSRRETLRCCFCRPTYPAAYLSNWLPVSSNLARARPLPTHGKH